MDKIEFDVKHQRGKHEVFFESDVKITLNL